MVVLDQPVLPGVPLVGIDDADAIRHSRDVIESAAAATAEPDVALPEPAPAVQPGAVPIGGGGEGDGGGEQTRLVGITSCPTGIAHTFMAAEGLRRAAEGLGYWIKVETQGSVGAKNVLTAEEIAAADAVVIAADTKVDLSRFAGKRVYETGTKPALKHGDEVIKAALDPGTPVLAAARVGSDAGSSAAPAGAGGGAKGSPFKAVYQHLMTGISHMLPLIVAGGLLISISFAGMTPPLGLALATVLFCGRWLPEEREAGKSAWVLGLAFITEGAIPFAARSPLRIIPACMLGSAVAGAISEAAGVRMTVPHGGILNSFVPGAVTHVAAWGLALVIGIVVTTGALFATTATARASAPALTPAPQPA